MRVAYFTAGTIGAGHQVRAVAIARALRRRGLACDFRVYRPLEGPSQPATPGEVRVAVSPEELAEPRRVAESALFRALRAYAPDVLLVDLFWAPLHFALARLTCEAWLLVRRCPADWFSARRGFALDRARYARILAIEPDAHPSVPDAIAPVVVCNPDENLGPRALRQRLGVADGVRLAAVAHAGRPGELATLREAAGPASESRHVATFELSGPDAIFPLAPWLSGADEVFTGAGYNAFWEARWLGYADRARHVPFERPVDDQRWRLSHCAQVRPSDNGADQLAAWLAAHPAAARPMPARAPDADLALAPALDDEDGAHASPFGALIAPFPVDEFLRHALGREMRHWPGEPGRAAGLLGWPDLARLTFGERDDLARVKLTSDGRPVDPARVVRTDASSGAPSLRHGEFVQLLRRGAELALDEVDRAHAPVRALCEELEWLVRATVRASVTASWTEPRAASTQPARREPDDLLLVQLAGRSHWRVFGRGVRDGTQPPSRAPFVGVPENAPGDDPYWDDWLEDGDVMYVPRGVFVASRPGDEPSLLLALRWTNPSGLDFGAWLAQRLRFRVAARAEIPRGAQPSELKRYVEQVRAELSALCSVENLERFLREHDRTPPARGLVGLQWALAPGAVLALDGAVVESRARVPQPPRVVTEKGLVEWGANGAVWTFPREYEGVLRCLASRRRWPFEALRAAAEVADPNALRAMLEDLADKGLVAVWPP